jgi:uncharacterized protein YrrD
MTGKDATELVSMPVIATSEGRELGRIRDVLFDPGQQVLLGLLVNSSAGNTDVPMFVQRSAIKGVGNDAVTVEDGSALQPYAAHDEARRVVESGIHLRGATVMTEGGDAVGKVDKVMLAEDGTIEGYTTNSGLLGFGEKNEISSDQVLRIGADAVIISDLRPRTDPSSPE